MDDPVELERQRCLRCVDLLLRTVTDSVAGHLLTRLRNQIASGEEPLTLEQQLEELDDDEG